jgi:hypothetical protein
MVSNSCNLKVAKAYKLMSWAEFYLTTDGQLASLSWNKAPIWGLRPDLYYLCDSYGLVLVGRPLWREDGYVFYICCWPLPAQSFFGPSPLGLATIFYCLPFETSLFVAGSRWRYSIPPPHGEPLLIGFLSPRVIWCNLPEVGSWRAEQQTPPRAVLSCISDVKVARVLVTAGTE